MESPTNASIPIPVVLVLYDFCYMWKDNREISVKKGEKLLLLEKTNKDWWQVARPTERKSFFVPAQYVKIMVKQKTGSHNEESLSGSSTVDSVLYENLDSLKQQVDLPNISNVNKSDFKSSKIRKEGKEIYKFSQDNSGQKPVPKIRTKVLSSKSNGEEANKSKTSDAVRPSSQNIDSDKSDKSDKSKKNESHDFISSPPKELKASNALPINNKSCRVENAPVAVENLVYCNVPLKRDKSFTVKQKVKSSDLQSRANIDSGKNRMKNSYNLNPKTSKPSETPKHAGTVESEHCTTHVQKRKSNFNQNFSKSLEKLADEIQFEPQKVSVGSKSLSVDNYSKTKQNKMPKNNLERKQEKKGRTNEVSVLLEENKIEPQYRSVFSRFRRSLHHSSSFKSNNLKKLGKSSKKACELSLSWEGGLDKIQEKKEIEEKPQVTPLGLQRSRTFMFAERSPLSIRSANKIFHGKHRLDTAYHSQRKPEEKVTLSTFKPIVNLNVTHSSHDTYKELGKRDPINECGLEEEKFQRNIPEFRKNKNLTEYLAEAQREKDCRFRSGTCDSEKISTEKKNPYKSVTKSHQKEVKLENEMSNKTSGQEGFTFYSEPYSNSESEDNLEEKSLSVIADKSLKSHSSIESNLTVSEGTELSESDESSPLNSKLSKGSEHSSGQPVNKRRTSLVRSKRVESSKVRKVTARLPPTPPPEEKPMKDLGNGWGVYVSKDGRNYYFNEKTGEKNWKPPRKTLNQEKILIGSHESVNSDGNLFDTSSPLSENCHLSNSLNRSNGSLNSKSTFLDSCSIEAPKSGSVFRWREDSTDDLNRSSYNSSPITGLSLSSTYSLNKSSRDSLNRLSPVENIPSEEEGLELHDHVYLDDVSSYKKDDQVQAEEGSKAHKGSDATFHVKPGWKNYYDEDLDQMYFMYEDRKEKWILSFDSEERVFFFEETSKKSLWALPDYSNENNKPEGNFLIQRSATESALSNNEPSARLRHNKDGDKGGRITGSTRSSKAQSMLIEPKFDVSPKDGNKTFSMPRDLSKIYGEIIRIGVLNKTKILENGKKLRKNWTPAFIVLTESYLFFFKDAKSFQNMKNVISSNSNHMCLSLQGAVIEKGDKISSRKNVYKISSENTDVLIQTDKTAEAEEWFKDIESVIQNQQPQESSSPAPNRTSNSPLLDLNSPSKVSRTKSLKVRTKETGSMEDLSTTPEERQNKIKARLKKFFIRRPTVDSLKKKGIWKDEPVFGCSLEQVTKNRNPRVPVFVEKCIECIESKEENMKTDGLYRASGNLSQVQKIRLEVDQNNLSIMKEEEDVHVLTGSLKLFFRELKEPLIPSKQLEPALLATDKQLRKERIKDFQKIVKNLPASNYDTLKFLLQHLLRVKEYHKFNRMNISNLAIVFGPTLMWPEQESANMALELMQQNVVIECLLKEFHEIFT